MLRVENNLNKSGLPEFVLAYFDISVFLDVD